MPTISVSTLPTTSLPTQSLNRLKQSQVDAYNRDGLLLVPNLFNNAEINQLKQLIQIDPTIEHEIGGPLDSHGNASEFFAFSGVPDDLLGAFVRVERLVETSRDLLAREEIYHWHTKISFKPPGTKARWDWHQDYGSWYKEGALYPNSLTAMIAVDPVDQENGCLEIIRGSHRCGRIDHIPVGRSMGADPQWVEWLLERNDLILCEMTPGDCVFFHSNVLHSSGPNLTNRPRTVLQVSYNAVDSAPPANSLSFTGHRFEALNTIPDSALLSHNWGEGVDIKTHDRLTRIKNHDRARGQNIYGYTFNRKYPEGTKQD
ncbi:MAG: phytanoyl-CoA dioxygenase family protein [SAR202 cluster bacterium]|nr:phytanoyl-CoA dioxygenase family protein [SAR202 cluster bacterium]